MANKKKDNPLIRVTVSLDPNDYRAFESIAREQDRSTAYMIRQAMAEYLTVQESEPSSMPPAKGEGASV